MSKREVKRTSHGHFIYTLYLPKNFFILLNSNKSSTVLTNVLLQKLQNLKPQETLAPILVWSLRPNL